MTESDLKRLGRRDLLQLLYKQGQETARLEERVELLENELKESGELVMRLKGKLDDKDRQFERLVAKLDDKDQQIEHLIKRLNEKDELLKSKSE